MLDGSAATLRRHSPPSASYGPGTGVHNYTVNASSSPKVRVDLAPAPSRVGLALELSALTGFPAEYSRPPFIEHKVVFRMKTKRGIENKGTIRMKNKYFSWNTGL